jgi:hypothetical protein
MILSLLLVIFGASAMTASAQRRGFHRPVIIYHHPFYGGFGYDPFFYDPYYQEMRERSYLESRVRGNENELEKHKQKYYADGVLTDKERRELADDEKDYNKSVRQLNRYRRDY